MGRIERWIFSNNRHLHDLSFPSWNVSARKLLDFGSSAGRLFYQKGVGNLWILLWIGEHSPSSIDFERREEIVDRIECFESIDKSNPRSLRPHFSPRKDENLYTLL